MSTLTLFTTNANAVISSADTNNILTSIAKFFPGSFISLDINRNIHVDTNTYNIILSKGIPTSLTGSDNDRYFNTTDGTIYGKVLGDWQLLGTIDYIAVIPGPYYINANSVNGPGAVSVGPTGPTGPSGPISDIPGPTGPQGNSITGPTGPQGHTGPAGSPIITSSTNVIHPIDELVVKKSIDGSFVSIPLTQFSEINSEVALDGINLNNFTDSITLPSSGGRLFLRNGALFIALPSGVFPIGNILNSPTGATGPTNIIVANPTASTAATTSIAPTAATAPTISTPLLNNSTEYDTDEDTDMPISPFNPTVPSQTLNVVSTNASNVQITNLLTLANTKSGPFQVEIYNSSAEFGYLGFSNNANVLTLDEQTSYVLAPSERRIFVLPSGYSYITATLGGNGASGEMRMTVISVS